MAQRQRRRKHRGTQAGTVRRKGRTSRPTSRSEAREHSRQRRVDRLSRPPSWRGAINRAVLAALVFFGALVLVLGQSVGSSLAIASFMFVLYIPMGYSMDSFIYRFRQRRKEKERLEAQRPREPEEP